MLAHGQVSISNGSRRKLPLESSLRLDLLRLAREGLAAPSVDGIEPTKGCRGEAQVEPEPKSFRVSFRFGLQF